jgi:HD-GYP domain-containing protein (c-di-GMP phosphodiesterase class II)
MDPLLSRLELHHGPGFGDHGTRVAGLSHAMADKIGLRRRDADRLLLAGLLHDLGKTGVDPDVLDRAAPLSDEETAEVQRHPELGYRHLTDLVHPAIAEAVLCHHERWDGEGYPSGIRGNDIPVMARIILAADAFDVMTSGRGYASRLTVAEAWYQMRRESGRQFDPAVIDALACVDERLLEDMAVRAPFSPSAIFGRSGHRG